MISRASNPQAEPDERRAPALLVWITLVLIAYASLYPFAFNLTQLVEAMHGPWLSRMFAARSAPVDTVANLFFYIPLGFVLVMRRARTNIATLLACGARGLSLSICLEVLQHAVATRTPSALDVLLNGASSVAGALLAAGFRNSIVQLKAVRWFRQAEPDVVLVSLLAAWVLLHAAPFIPRMGLYRISVSLESLMAWQWSLAGSASWFTRHLIFSVVLRALVKREVFWRGYAIALVCSLGSQILFVQHSLEPDELIGAMATLPLVGLLRVVRTERTLRVIFWLAGASLALSALAPFRLLDTPQAFHWLPFAGVMDSGVELGFFSMIGKTFVYLGLLWLTTASGTSLLRSAAGLIAFATLLECAQLFLQDRAAELSDPLLVLLPAGIIAMAKLSRKQRAPHAGSRAE